MDASWLLVVSASVLFIMPNGESERHTVLIERQPFESRKSCNLDGEHRKLNNIWHNIYHQARAIGAARVETDVPQHQCINAVES